MKKLLFTLLLISSTVFSQNDTIKRDLGFFNYLKVYNGISVKLQKGSVSQIEITGKKADEVMHKNISGKLKISMRFPKTFQSGDVDVTIHYKNDLDILDANEGSVITAKDTIKQDHITLKTQEGALIKLNTTVKRLTVKAVTGSEIKVGGTTDNQIVDTGSGGVYKGYKMESSQATVTSSSAALAEITVKDFLDAEVRLGGGINYKGEPDTVKTNKIMGGTIKPMDE